MIYYLGVKTSSNRRYQETAVLREGMIMEPSLLAAPVSEVEISELLNIEGMPKTGKDIVRRMAFELENIRAEIKRLKE